MPKVHIHIPLPWTGNSKWRVTQPSYWFVTWMYQIPIVSSWCWRPCGIHLIDTACQAVQHKYWAYVNSCQCIIKYQDPGHLQSSINRWHL